MLNIINSALLGLNGLKPFFEDCYRRISVREYSRLRGMSPPTASKTLAEYSKSGLLLAEKDRNYIFYYANRENRNFIDLSRIYWRERLSEVIEYLERSLLSPTIILFGSLSKAESKEDSDIDLCILASKKEINLSGFERKLKRKLEIFYFDSIRDIKNRELANNIINGYVLRGKIRS